MKKSGLLRHVSMKPLFILSVVASALLVACSSGDGDENAVTQPETGDIDFLQESSNSLDKGENGENFVTSGSNAIMSSGAVNMSSTTPVASSESVVWETMTDSRDGKTYKVVTIGSQTWMAENLNYDAKYSYCYENSADSCAKYGRFYSWAVAVGRSEVECGNCRICGLRGAVRGVCPEGWHLPDVGEWETLYSAVGKNAHALQAKGREHPDATDAYGFAVLPLGVYDYIEGEFFGYVGEFWSSTEEDDYGCSAYSWIMHPNQAFVMDGNKYIGNTVRCLKDGPGFLQEPSSSSAVNKPSTTSAISPKSVVRGYVTDPRDGKKYKIVVVGSQTWMAENLNYETEQSYCYRNSADSCAKYGRHYTWDAAINVCPSGWHLPDLGEWEALYSAMGKNPLAMQAKGWPEWPDATDVYGFSALPAGYYEKNFLENYSNVGYHNAFFWSSTEVYKGNAHFWYLNAGDAGRTIFGEKEHNGFSVRCIQDVPGCLPESGSSCAVSILNTISEVSPDSVVRGGITDSRDGKPYKTVTIGSQTWMAENLNYETEQSYCYRNSADSCVKYGRLYTWDAAINVCPSGWHLPDTSEWKNLYLAVGKNANAMLSAGWAEGSKATDAYGFSVLPGGCYGCSRDFDLEAFFWSASEERDSSAYNWYFFMFSDAFAEYYSSTKSRGLSVRCVQDDP